MPLTVCSADPARDDIRLFWDDGTGAPLGTFDALEDKAGEITFAMNGGMYHPDRAPVGLFVENGREVAPLVTRDGPGNFGLLPNGVLCLGDTASIHESRAFAQSAPHCTYASQSGPMLVIDGQLHPRFLPNSDSTFRRNGVGVSKDGMLYAVISDGPVNFHRFARFFRDVLKTPNALFMDGKVSRLYAPALDRHDFGFPLGPMLGVVE
ncbi:MAG: phosphodiester glycosidase family protein [Silicimonas sp.]|nr:phosphodiester glycosidase family protein [Silicimonas sp.]